MIAVGVFVRPKFPQGTLFVGQTATRGTHTIVIIYWPVARREAVFVGHQHTPYPCPRSAVPNARYDILRISAVRPSLPASFPPVLQLDGDGDGVLDREDWARWWAERCQQASPSPEHQGGSRDDDHNAADDSGGGGGGGGSGGDGGGGAKVLRLAERARQGRRRANTDIHTAAWRGDLALVKVFVAADALVFDDVVY